MDYYRNFLEVNDNFNCILSVVVNMIVIVICEFKFGVKFKWSSRFKIFFWNFNFKIIGFFI